MKAQLEFTYEITCDYGFKEADDKYTASISVDCGFGPKEMWMDSQFKSRDEAQWATQHVMEQVMGRLFIDPPSLEQDDED